jgi:hypothetical protein
MQDRDRRRQFVLRTAGWLTTPLCYLVMLSVVITAARRSTPNP